MLKMPLALPRLPASAVLLAGDVFAFTGVDRNGNELSCHRTYETFVARIGKSRATVGRSLKAVKDKHLVKRDKDKGYVFEIENLTNDTYLRCPQFICTEKFKIRGKERLLLPNECRVYAYIFTHCDNKKNKKKVCVVSIAELAAALQLAEKSVYKALWSLIKARLISRSKEDRGVNAYKKSRYTLHTKILRKHGINVADVEQKPEEPTQKSTLTTLTQIDNYYSEKRAKAELIAERNRALANKSEAYREAYGWLNDMTFELAFAEVRGENVEGLKRRIKIAEHERRIALQELGLTEDDLAVQYECKLCNDTGFRIDTGRRCSCYPLEGLIGGVGELNK